MCRLTKEKHGFRIHPRKDADVPLFFASYTTSADDATRPPYYKLPREVKPIELAR